MRETQGAASQQQRGLLTSMPVQVRKHKHARVFSLRAEKQVCAEAASNPALKGSLRLWLAPLGSAYCRLSCQ